MSGGPEPEAGDRRPEWHMPRRMSVFLAVSVYACFMWVVLNPKTDRVATAALGPNPFGLPARWVMAGIVTAWYTPYWWVFRHALAMANAARLSRRGFWPGILVPALRSGDADARRDALITLGGFAYFLASAAAWIAYASQLGI